MELISQNQSEISTSRRKKFREGQRIKYQGEEAEVIAMEPLLIIKLKNRIICGCLLDQIEPIRDLSATSCSENK
jgi:hypothetical protein